MLVSFNLCQFCCILSLVGLRIGLGGGLVCVCSLERRVFCVCLVFPPRLRSFPSSFACVPSSFPIVLFNCVDGMIKKDTNGFSAGLFGIKFGLLCVPVSPSRDTTKSPIQCHLFRFRIWTCAITPRYHRTVSDRSYFHRSGPSQSS